jgi:UDP-N-acetylbacillosamine N-acetyltransferase
MADVALDNGVRALLFIDANARDGERFLGFDVVAFSDRLPEGWAWIPGSGDNEARQHSLAVPVFDAGRLCSLISRRAYIGAAASIAPGAFVGIHAHVGPRAAIGEGCIVNTAAIVEHDCLVGRYTHVSVNATIAGSVRIGERVFVGAGAVVIDGVTIADDVVLGAGATVTEDIEQAGTYVGTPARRIRST